MKKIPWLINGVTSLSLGATDTFFTPETAGDIVTSSDKVEANIQKTYRRSGTVGGLSVIIASNNRNADVTFVSRVNGGNGTQTITVPAGTTGTFVDLTHSDTITSGNTHSVKYVAAGTTGGLTASGVGGWYEESVGVTQFTTVRFAWVSSGLTRYAPFVSPTSGFASGEAGTETLVKTSGTVKNMACYVSANARTTNTVITLRKNGADTALALTIPAGTTGLIENVVNTVAVAAGDLINWKIVAGSGTESMTTDISLEIEADKGIIVGLRNSNVASNTVAYSGMTGMGSSWAANLTSVPGVIAAACTLSTARLINAANPHTGAGTFTLVKNGVDTDVVITVPALTTGTFEDTTHSVVVAAGDTCYWRADTGGSSSEGNMNTKSIAIEVTPTEVVTSGGSNLLLLGIG
jgi:hypothetical protein